MSRTIKAIIVILIITIIGVIIGKILIKKRREALLSYPPPKVYPIPVEYTVAKEGSISETFHYVGEVLPYTYANVSTKVAGTVLKVYKREGEHFKKGELLAEIDSSQIESTVLALESEKRAKEALLSGLKAQLKAAEIAAKNAKNEYEREKFLYERGAVPKEAVEKYENAYHRALSQVKTIKSKIGELKLAVKAIEEKKRAVASQLQYTEVRAIKDGTVAKIFLYPGAVAVPGRPIMRVFYDSDGFRVLVNAPPEEAKEIEVGAPVKIEGKPIGVVSKIYPAADPKSGLYTVEVKLKRLDGLKPAQTVRADLKGKAYSGIVLPYLSVLHMKDTDMVLKLKGTEVIPTPVKVLKQVNQWVVVSGNVKPGDKVVVGRESKLLEVLRRKSAVPAEAFNG